MEGVIRKLKALKNNNCIALLVLKISMVKPVSMETPNASLSDIIFEKLNFHHRTMGAAQMHMHILVSLTAGTVTLHSLAKVVALPLTFNDVAVDFASGDVVVARQLNVNKTLVVSQVEIDLASVIQDIALAVLVRRECTGVNVQVCTTWVRRHKF